MKSNVKYCTECGNEMKVTTEICTKCGAANEVDAVKVIKGYSEKVVEVGRIVKNASERTIEIGKQTTQQIKENEEIQAKKEEYLNKAKDVQNKSKNVVAHLISKIKEKNIFKKSNLIKVGIISAIILSLGIILTKEESKEGFITKFQDAIIENNASKLEKMIKPSDKRLVVDENTVNALLAYYEENPSKLSEHIQALSSESGKCAAYNIVKSKEMFKEKYYIDLAPRYVVISGNTDNVEVEVKYKDQVIHKIDKYGEIGPLAPGKYTLTAKFKNKSLNNLEIEETKEINIFNSGYSTENKLYLFEDLNTVDVYSNNLDAELYIDGKSTGKKIGEGITLENIPNGVELYATTKYKEDTSKSNVEKVNGSYDIELIFDESIAFDIEEAMNTFFQGYENDFIEAVNSGDFSIIEPYLSTRGSLYNDHKNYIPYIYEKGIREKLYSFEITNIEELSEGQYEVKIDQKIGIINNGEEEVKDYKYTYIVEISNNDIYIVELIE